MDSIIAYLKNGKLPENKTKARILRLNVACYVIYDDKINRRGYSMPLLKCVTPSKVNYIIRGATKAYMETILGTTTIQNT